MDIFSICYNVKVNTFNMKKKNTLNYPKSAAKDFFPRDSRTRLQQRGKRAISVRAIEVLQYAEV